MTKQALFGPALFLTLLATASAQSPGWQHEGALFILTTPEGANLPATAEEKDFPLLVRLHKGFFDFSQAKAEGADLRFSADSKPLAYQVEEWDATNGTACVWVRIPVIKGNARQEIYLQDTDRTAFLKFLARSAEIYQAEVLAYVLMANHFHLLVKTP